jgi:hypothetical protein
MPFYPWTIFLVIGIWLFIFISTGKWFMLGGIIVIGFGIIAYYIRKMLMERQIK